MAEQLLITPKNEKVSRREKIFYGLGDMSSNIIIAAISIYYLYFMVTIGGIPAGMAALVFLVTKIGDAVTDYIMGILSDRTKSRWGKRRVYMLFGAIPYGLFFFVIWLVPFPAGSIWLNFFYYTLVYNLFCTIWTVVYVPYTALTANMTKDYDERSSITGYRIVLANVGLILGAGLFGFLAGKDNMIYTALLNAGQTADNAVRNSFVYSALIFGVLAGVIMLISALGTKERYDDGNEHRYRLRQTLKELFKLKEFRNTMMYYLLSMVGFDIMMAVFVWFIEQSIGISTGISSIFIGLPLVVGICSAAFWVKQSVKKEKHTVYRNAVIMISFSLLLCLIVPDVNGKMGILPFVLTGNTELIAALLLGFAILFVGFAMSAIQILPWASIPDVIEVDEYTNGHRREGAYYGIVSFMYKMASGFSIFFVGIVLQLFGYRESYGAQVVVQPESALLAVRLTISIIPALIFIASVFYGYRANMGRANFERIKKELDLRHLAANHGSAVK